MGAYQKMKSFANPKRKVIQFWKSNQWSSKKLTKKSIFPFVFPGKLSFSPTHMSPWKIWLAINMKFVFQIIYFYAFSDWSHHNVWENESLIIAQCLICRENQFSLRSIFAENHSHFLSYYFMGWMLLKFRPMSTEFGR